MTTLTTEEKQEALSEIMEMCGEIAKRLKTLDDNRLISYHLAEFQGRDYGWVGGPYFIDDVADAYNGTFESEEDVEIELSNPWTGEPSGRCMTWSDIKDWANDNVHPTNIREWLNAARLLYDDLDAAGLGKLIIGS